MLSCLSARFTKFAAIAAIMVWQIAIESFSIAIRLAKVQSLYFRLLKPNEVDC